MKPDSLKKDSQSRCDDRRDALMASTDSIRYQDTVLTVENHHTLTPAKRVVPRVSPNHPFYENHRTYFDIERFQYPAPPIELGNVMDLVGIQDEWVNVLRCPIKYPGTPFKVPQKLKFLLPLIRRVAEYEIAFNKGYEDTFIHITFDSSKVKADTYHRYPGFHGDGVQGAKFSQDRYTVIEHSYIVSTSPPTEFCLQPFFFQHLNDARHNLFHEMELQARDSNIFTAIPWHLYLIDPYMVHRTPHIYADVYRVFARITVAYTELMNPHNTVNPCFPSQIYSPRHDIRKFLSTYPGEVPWEMYGFSDGPERAQRK